jgi:uridine monophosphate synthetase
MIGYLVLLNCIPIVIIVIKALQDNREKENRYSVGMIDSSRCLGAFKGSNEPKMNFFDKLTAAIATHQSLLVVGLDPNPEMMPCRQSRSADLLGDLAAWLGEAIAVTQTQVCAYKLTLGFYEALGSRGFELLEDVLSQIPDVLPIILDAKQGDLNTSTLFARTLFEEWGVDAVTVSPFAGQDAIAPFLLYPDRGVFVLCHTSNPSAIALQEFPNADNPYYLQVVREAKSWGIPEQVMLEVGTANPAVLQKIRTIAPERFILMRSLWAESGQLAPMLQAGLNSNGDGLLIPVPQDFLSQAQLSESVELLRLEVNQVRNAGLDKALSCELWTPDLCLMQSHPYQELILQLFDLGCLLFGDYVQASGATFSYYVDLRQIISNPQVFQQVLQAYADILKTLTFDRLAGIPYGSLPTATGLSLMLNRPLIYPRKEVKAHGTRRLIEGKFEMGETVAIVDDIFISGKSAIEGAEKLQSAGLQVKDIVVLIDHESGVEDRLRSRGYNPYSVLKISEITETLYAAGRITEVQYQSLQEE